MDQSRKKIRGAVEIGSNYVFHLMAAARIGFDSDYADRYADSVHPDDLAFLQKHREVLTFGGGSTSELVAPIIAWPAYFNLDSKEALQEQFHLLDEVFKNDDGRPFLERYASDIAKLDHWWYTIDEDLLKMFAPHRDLIQSLGRILARNFDAYRETVWPKELSGLTAVAKEIDDYFESRDIIGQWEKTAGTAFKFGVYEIVLCSAIKNGPNANSLGYDRVVFYSGSPRETMMEFISHEVGTHILIGLLKELAGSNRFKFSDLYEGFELLARYYNTLILRSFPLSYPMSTFPVDEYLEIFRKLHRAEPEISPRDLLIKGIENFLASKTAL